MARTKIGVVWVRPPEELVKALERYGERVLVAVHVLAQYIGTKMQNESRRNAAWQDRTGNARSGLFSTVVQEVAGKLVIIYLSHGNIYYGKFLELAHGQKYAIVMPTIQANLPVLKQMLDDLFR